MQDLLDRAMNLAQTRGAQYADARVIENETETLVLQNGEMRTLESSKNIELASECSWMAHGVLPHRAT